MVLHINARSASGEYVPLAEKELLGTVDLGYVVRAGNTGLKDIRRKSGMNNRYLSITLGDLTLALPLDHVHKVARMVSITPVGEGGPCGLLGVINLGGRVVPVFDPRIRLGLASKKMDPADQIVFAWANERLIGLWVDEAGEVFRAESGGSLAAVEHDSRTAAIAPGDSVWRDLSGIAGVAALAEGLAVIRDLDAFLNEADERQLDAALEALDAEDIGREPEKEGAR